MITPDQIRSYPLFAGLSETELADMASHLVKRAFAKGVYLFHPGHPVLNIYLIESGMARAFFTNSRGKEFALNLIGSYSVIGMPLIHEEQTRMLGVSAVTPLVTLVLTQKDLLRIAQQSPALLRNVNSLVDAYIQALILHVRSLVTLSVNGRLATVFLFLGRSAQDQKIKAEIDLPLSQAELAGCIGASRGHVNRAMAHLQKLGLIRAEGQKIVFLDRPGLERMSEELISE